MTTAAAAAATTAEPFKVTELELGSSIVCGSAPIILLLLFYVSQ